MQDRSISKQSPRLSQVIHERGVNTNCGKTCDLQ